MLAKPGLGAWREAAVETSEATEGEIPDTLDLLTMEDLTVEGRRCHQSRRVRFMCTTNVQ